MRKVVFEVFVEAEVVEVAFDSSGRLRIMGTHEGSPYRSYSEHRSHSIA
jgi:hypothetical protein